MKQVEEDVKSECISWADQRCKPGMMMEAVLRNMSNHFLVVIVLPFHAAEIRQEVKYWGNTSGLMTQCIVSVFYLPTLLAPHPYLIVAASKRPKQSKEQIQ